MTKDRILFEVNTDSHGMTDTSLMSTFLKPGIVPFNGSFRVTDTKQSAIDFVNQVLVPSGSGNKLTSVVSENEKSFSGVLHTETEYLNVSITQCKEHVLVSLNGYLTIANKYLTNQFFSKNPYQTPRTPGVYSVTIYHYYIDQMGMTRKINHYKTTESFKDIRDDLYPKVNVPLLMKMYAESSENNLILTGSPGTGKTCFVKKCLRDLALEKQRDIRVIYVKDRELLKKDEFWAKLATERPDVLVLDDLDDELLPRTEGRNDIVNNMLSFSDGLFDVTTKIIITTNQPNTAIDKALIRPGRCFDILALPNLTWEEALHVWLTGFEEKQESFARIFGTDAGKMVSQAALVSEYQRFKKEGEAPYLLDSSISIRTTVEDGGIANQ